MNKRDLSNTSFAFNLGSTTFLFYYKYSIPNFNMNIITLILCYFIYIAYLCIYHIFCIVYSLYEFVDEKVENKLKSNQINIQTFNKKSYGYINLHWSYNLPNSEKENTYLLTQSLYYSIRCARSLLQPRIAQCRHYERGFPKPKAGTCVISESVVAVGSDIARSLSPQKGDCSGLHDI